MPRITDVNDLGQLNRALEGIDKLEKKFGTLNSQLSSITHQVNQIDTKHVPASSNNLSFTWTGGTLTLSWPAGSVVDRNNSNVPIAAGSIVGLLASTYYWLAWNQVHKQMVAQIDASILLPNTGNIVICQVFTGTAGQTGLAGGGGSSGISDLTGARYKLF